MDFFPREIDGFKMNNAYCTDTYGLYIEKTHWDVLNKAKVFGETSCQGKKSTKLVKSHMGCFSHII